jgi:hypothetical protein
MHPAEIEVCNKLAELGNYYSQMNEFVDNYSFGKSFENKKLKCNLLISRFLINEAKIRIVPVQVLVLFTGSNFYRNSKHKSTAR